MQVPSTRVRFVPGVLAHASTVQPFGSDSAPVGLVE